MPHLVLALRALFVVALSAYLVICAQRRALRLEHGLAFGLVAGYIAAGPARAVLDRFAPLALTGVTYDLTRIALRPRHRHVHVAGPYELELRLFSIPAADGRRTLNEWLRQHQRRWLDLLTGIPYLTYLIVPIGLGVALCWMAPPLAVRFGWAFFALTILGMATWRVFPVAPPWYVARYGFGPIREVEPSPAGATRFDQHTGTGLFRSLYSRSAEVFGAIPSLHCAYALLALLYGRELGSAPLTAALSGFAALMAFAAVYLQHHYVIDLFAGWTYALATWGGEHLVSSVLHHHAL
jgi:membrane-associated phospholipid phosphatase